MFYLAIFLPLFSAIGLYFFLRFLRKIIKKDILYKIFKTFILIIVIILTFFLYFDIPTEIKLYQTMNSEQYKALTYLKNFESSNVISDIDLSPAVYPVSGHYPIATIHFYGNRTEVETFFYNPDCNEKLETINNNKISFIITKNTIDCNFLELIYDNQTKIYKIKS
jgi:hypothetical protein